MSRARREQRLTAAERERYQAALVDLSVVLQRSLTDDERLFVLERVKAGRTVTVADIPALALATAPAPKRRRR